MTQAGEPTCNGTCMCEQSREQFDLLRDVAKQAEDAVGWMRKRRNRRAGGEVEMSYPDFADLLDALDKVAAKGPKP